MKAEKGIYKDFMAMLLRAYDSQGRDLFSSSSSDTDSASSDGFGSVVGAGSSFSSVSGGAQTPGVHQRNVLYQRHGHLQTGAVDRQQRAAVTIRMGHLQGRSTKCSQAGTAAGSALQQGAEDDPLLSWAAQRMGATGADEARQNAQQSKAAVRPHAVVSPSRLCKSRVGTTVLPESLCAAELLAPSQLPHCCSCGSDLVTHTAMQGRSRLLSGANGLRGARGVSGDAL